MNIVEARKAEGTLVHVSDGTPRPPERFNKKLQAWEHNNYSGILREVKVSWDDTKYTRSIEIKNLGYAIFNRSGYIDNVVTGEHPLALAHESVMYMLAENEPISELTMLCQYENYAIDHIKHWNAIPCEFEASDGTVWNVDDCWLYAEVLRLNDFIIPPDEG